jgi:ADP-heptose:LPS heptosyltransferase
LKKKILVFRFSALGDVAMTIPALWSFHKQYPDYEIWIVSRSFAADLVGALPNVHFFAADLKGRHKGIQGLFRLFRELKELGPWSAVIDLHGVLRTHVLTLLFKFTHTKVSKIDKGRKEKKALTRKENKVFKPLQHTIDRYVDVFVRAGFPFKLTDFSGKQVYSNNPVAFNGAVSEVIDQAREEGKRLIGVAPFAKHPWKSWPEEKMFELLSMVNEQGFYIILFGGGANEKEKLQQWASNLKNACTFACQLKMADELNLMSQISVMVSMDSANMHLASLAGTPVVSIWGATHPYAGFFGYGQSLQDAVQIDLGCRPCSVFGNKKCHRGDFACMMQITPEMVLKKILTKKQKRPKLTLH